MTWTSFHRRADVLRDVLAAADQRRDGELPRDVEGVSTAFVDDVDLLATLQLKWHTRLAGRIEHEQMYQPVDLRAAVVRAWHRTADELPGLRAILDEQWARPADEATASVLRRSRAKEHVLLAVMAGLASAQDARAATVGAGIETEARATWPAHTAALPGDDTDRPTLLGRLKAALAA